MLEVESIVGGRSVGSLVVRRCSSLVLAPGPAPPPVRAGARRSSAPVADPFREPACAWCPGNRGIEYGTGAGRRSCGRRRPATVTFAGVVAGTRYVVVDHADGRLRATYGNLASSALRGR